MITILFFILLFWFIVLFYCYWHALFRQNSNIVYSINKEQLDKLNKGGHVVLIEKIGKKEYIADIFSYKWNKKR